MLKKVLEYKKDIGKKCFYDKRRFCSKKNVSLASDAGVSTPAVTQRGLAWLAHTAKMATWLFWGVGGL